LIFEFVFARRFANVQLSCLDVLSLITKFEQCWGCIVDDLGQGHIMDIALPAARSATAHVGAAAI
jgi:hypothetical protein